MSNVGEYLAEQTPGLGIAAYAAAVVAGDKVELACGGEARAGSGQPVTPGTRFHICSCSKAFTALAFAALVKQGLTEWDASAFAVVPEFELADPWISRQMTFRDLAGMRTGLGRDGIAEWGFRAEAPPAQRLSRARFMAFEAPFRDRFSYSNLGYIALAVAAERISGLSFEACLDQFVLRPLQLKSAGLGPGPNAAEPHMPIRGRMRPVPELTGDSSRGSARLYLCAEDAARWIAAMLAAAIRARSGQEALLGEAFSCQSVMRPRTGAALSAWGYGFGWSLCEYQGRQVFSHGGAGRGWRSIMVLDPDQRAGVMVMTAHEGAAAEGLALALLELAAGRAPPPWMPPSAAGAAQPPLTPAAALDDEPAGLYHGDLTGDVRIFRSPDGELRFAPEDAPAFDARLERRQGNLFKFEFDSPAMTAMPGDPPFQLSFHQDPDAGAWAASTYFGRLRRVAP